MIEHFQPLDIQTLNVSDQFIGIHWDEWFAIAALLYAVYVFGYSLAVSRMAKSADVKANA